MIPLTLSTKRYLLIFFPCLLVTIDSIRCYLQVREGQVAQYNFILVVGQQEVENKTVNVRTRDNDVKGAMSIPDLLSLFSNLKEKFE